MIDELYRVFVSHKGVSVVAHRVIKDTEFTYQIMTTRTGQDKRVIKKKDIGITEVVSNDGLLITLAVWADDAKDVEGYRENLAKQIKDSLMEKRHRIHQALAMVDLEGETKNSHIDYVLGEVVESDTTYHEEFVYPYSLSYGNVTEGDHVSFVSHNIKGEVIDSGGGPIIEIKQGPLLFSKTVFISKYSGGQACVFLNHKHYKDSITLIRRSKENEDTKTKI